MRIQRKKNNSSKWTIEAVTSDQSRELERLMEVLQHIYGRTVEFGYDDGESRKFTDCYLQNAVEPAFVMDPATRAIRSAPFVR